jgi:hypothetical protein
VSSRSNALASSWPARALVRRWAGLLILAVVLGGTAGGADAARKRIVVLDITGPKGAKVQRGVVKLLKKDATIIGKKAYVAAAKQVEGYAPDAGGVSKVARVLQAHGVITGKVSKRGRKYRLTLQIVEGRSGEVVGDGISVALKRGRLNTAARRKLQRELKAVLSDLPDPASEVPADEPVAAAEGTPEETPETAPPVETPPPPDPAAERAAARARARVRARERERRRRVAIAQMKAGSAELGAVSRPAAPPERDPRDSGIETVAGVSFASRKLDFTIADGLQDVPQGYDGALVPGVYAAAELYPMALLQRRGDGVARDFGISLVVDKVLLIKSRLEGAGTDSLPTDQLRFGGGVVYRWNFGSATGPTLKLGVRYNRLSFSIDETQAEDPAAIEIPDVEYSYLDPGIGFRLPLGDRVALLAEGHYIYVLDAGQIQDPDQYGEASVFAFEGDLGGELKITDNLVARAGARYAQYSLDFEGNGDLTDRTGDGMQDVNAARDRYLGVYATAGVLF